MATTQALGTFGPAELACVKMVQLYVLARDRDSTPKGQRKAKKRHLRLAVSDLTAWRDGSSLPDFVVELLPSEVEKGFTSSTAACLSALREHLDTELAVEIAVETFVGLRWPKGTDWTDDMPDEGRREALALLGPAFAAVDARRVVKKHKAAAKRLRQDSLSPVAQAGMGAFMAGAAVVSGGAANAVGTAIGTHVLGYSGAAATSAGLALLGGGSLASGGFGMAGGTLLVWVSGKAASSAGRRMVGALLAKESSGAFMSELAKLDTVVRFKPEQSERLKEALGELRSQLSDELAEVAPSAKGRSDRMLSRASRIARDPLRANKHAKRLWADLPDKEERNLRASLRAVDYELRHLESPDWKRKAAKVPRLLGVPAASRLLDLADGR